MSDKLLLVDFDDKLKFVGHQLYPYQWAMMPQSQWRLVFFNPPQYTQQL